MCYSNTPSAISKDYSTVLIVRPVKPHTTPGIKQPQKLTLDTIKSRVKRKGHSLEKIHEPGIESGGLPSRAGAKVK